MPHPTSILNKLNFIATYYYTVESADHFTIEKNVHRLVGFNFLAYTV